MKFLFTAVVVICLSLVIALGVHTAFGQTFDEISSTDLPQEVVDVPISDSPVLIKTKAVLERATLPQKKLEPSLPQLGYMLQTPFLKYGISDYTFIPDHDCIVVSDDGSVVCGSFSLTPLK